MYFQEGIRSPDESNTYTFVILEGVVLLTYGKKVVICIVRTPFIFGLPDGVAKKAAQYKSITESGCIGYRLSSSQTLATIEQNQL